MRIVLDIEANGLLDQATTIWCICCKDIDNDEVQVFTGEELRTRFPLYIRDCSYLAGHNVIQYDIPVIERIIGCDLSHLDIFDTLVVSRLIHVGREGGHSLENWGKLLKFPKKEHTDFTQLSDEMIEYGKNDVELTLRLYKYLKGIVDRNGEAFTRAISIEQDMQRICLDMHRNGFYFDYGEARSIATELDNLLCELDNKIASSFPPKVEVVQLKTKTKLVTVPFNPGSPKQIVDRLWDAGWKPTERTKTHDDKVRKGKREKPTERDLRYGWKVNEANLLTLPPDAPDGCKYLVERIMLAARRRTLEEWFEAYNSNDHKIHGQFNPLGARSHRATHSNPNVGNIAAKKTIKYNSERLRNLAIDYGGRMRSLWTASPDKVLVGTDMESAHLRIFAHLIDDQDFVKALLTGKKEDGTDPHSRNKCILGDVCPDRDRAKTFIFSFLNGASTPKVSEIFGCSLKAAKEALDTFVRAYPGLGHLKQDVFPRDAARGWFEGIDGRKVRCDSEHLMMGMVLQNMESLIMKYTIIGFYKEMEKYPEVDWKLINFVHDELVTEVGGPIEHAELVGKIQRDLIKQTGEKFNLRCPMSGESKIGRTWLDVH